MKTIGAQKFRSNFFAVSSPLQLDFLKSLTSRAALIWYDFAHSCLCSIILKSWTFSYIKTFLPAMPANVNNLLEKLTCYFGETEFNCATSTCSPYTLNKILAQQYQYINSQKSYSESSIICTKNAINFKY